MESVVFNQPPVSFEADREHDRFDRTSYMHIFVLHTRPDSMLRRNVLHHDEAFAPIWHCLLGL